MKLLPSLRRRMPHRWFTFPLALATVGLALACTAEVEPDAISGRVVSFGRFEIQNGLPMLRESVDRVACDPGTTFGVDYRIEISGGGFGVLPIEFRWIHPELSIPSRKLWGTETPARRAWARG